jgi:aerobic carbon-monoxide dehydrogenase medium subunit
MRYVRASSFEEAAGLLAELGEDARAIAGGQSLVPMMNLRLAKPAVLVDLAGAGEPSFERDGGGVVVGALSRHCDLERSEVVAEECPLLAEAARFIGNVRVRNRGTIGGSLAHADPAGELPCVTVALGASIRTVSSRGRRVLPAREFFQTHYTTALEHDEVVTHVEVPALAARTGWSFQELARRTGDFAISAVAAVVTLEDDHCRDARLVACAVAQRPLELTEAEAVLRRAKPEEVLDEVESRACAAVSSNGYKATVTGVLARRAVVEAVDRARAR